MSTHELGITNTIADAFDEWLSNLFTRIGTDASKAGRADRPFALEDAALRALREIPTPYGSVSRRPRRSASSGDRNALFASSVA